MGVTVLEVARRSQAMTGTVTRVKRGQECRSRVLVGGGTPFFTALDNWVN